MNRLRLKLTTCVVLSASVALSAVHPWGNLRGIGKEDAPLLVGSAAPANVREILARKCADCHSTNTRWPAYSRLAPGSWLMEHDVHEARVHLNLSDWEQYDRETQIDLLVKIAAEVHSGQMPIKPYLLLHPSAKLTSKEQQLIYDWAKSERKRLRWQTAGLSDLPN